jgi:hypothetical protein
MDRSMIAKLVIFSSSFMSQSMQAAQKCGGRLVHPRAVCKRCRSMILSGLGRLKSSSFGCDRGAEDEDGGAGDAGSGWESANIFNDDAIMEF